MKAIKTHINNATLCEAGCNVLWNVAEANPTIQKEVCEKRGLETLLRTLKEHTDNENLSSSCCGAIGTLLSSPEAHSKYCTPDVIKAVEKCHKKHNDPEQIKQFLLSLKREEDPRVRDAVARGVCTKEAFPKCSEKCRCDENVYCSKCCVQQKVFRCLTCDKDKIKLYCEVCWKRDHNGHNGEEFFYPVRCGTKHKSMFN